MCSFHQLPICGIHCLKLTNCKSFDQPAENKLSMPTLISNILLLFITLALERNKLTITDSDYDLFRRHLSDDPVCSCRYICCSAKHPNISSAVTLQNKPSIKQMRMKETLIHFCLEAIDYTQKPIRIVFALLHDILYQFDKLVNLYEFCLKLMFVRQT